MTEYGAGILGVGVYLPQTIRRNDWWPESIVARWREKALHRVEQLPIPRTEGVELALAAMNRMRNDPFGGSIERRIMREDECSSEMEVAAAREAIRNAGVDPMEIDALVSFTACPDYLGGPSGGVVHQQLGLNPKCLTFSLEASCNSFPVQMTLADQMIKSGNMRHVLLIQSAGFSKVMPIEAPVSAWFGDGATAVVLGRVKSGFGVLAYDHGTDGTRHKAMVLGVPGKRWYDDGRTIGYSADPPMAQAIILGSIDRSREVIPAALKKAGVTAEDVDFYACHQGVPWLRSITQQFVGMERARWVDTFASFGSLSAANIGLVLSLGQRERMLRDGDLVAMFSGGTGETYSALVMRWGRG